VSFCSCCVEVRESSEVELVRVYGRVGKEMMKRGETGCSRVAPMEVCVWLKRTRLDFQRVHCVSHDSSSSRVSSPLLRGLPTRMTRAIEPSYDPL